MAFGFPVLTSTELATTLHEVLGEQFTEDDFKSPQSTRMQNLYAMLLQTCTSTQMDKIDQPQWQASQVVTHAELYDDMFPLMNLAVAMQRVMVACLVKDFKLRDLLNPKPKRTRRFLSALVNFWRFYVEREQVCIDIKEEIEGSIAERVACQDRINRQKEKINIIKMTRAEEEVQVNQLQGKIDELNGRMIPQQQEQALVQRDFTRLKASIAEKVALQEKHKLAIINKQEAVGKMRAQVVQSPERMKADIGRMHSALASRKETKKEKGQRVQELRGQKENCDMLLQSSEQGVSMISAINAELDKQREAAVAVEGIKDQTQVEKDQLRDLAAQEGHLNRQKETKQEKQVKLQLHHQHTLTELQENIQREQTELEQYCQKQEKKLSQVYALNEQKNVIKREMSEKENEHVQHMTGRREKYDRLLVSLDSYHKDLAVSWEQADPTQILG